jgi:hypothetical protein
MSVQDIKAHGIILKYIRNYNSIMLLQYKHLIVVVHAVKVSKFSDARWSMRTVNTYLYRIPLQICNDSEMSK